MEKIERPKSRQPIPPHAKRVFEGDIFDVYQWDQELYDGTSKIFEKIKRDDTVVVIPSLSDKRLIFIRDEQPSREPILTFPAGRMDKEGEEPLAAIQRELLEETGYSSEEWSLWKSYQPYSKIDWAIYIFIARNCVKAAEPDPGPGERISMSLLTLDEIIALRDDPSFVSDDIKVELTEAKYDAAAREHLEKKIFG
jgi:ADP-ribose pyrophosphatase